ncbi:MAG: hypothetical protein HZC40_12445 [Chloroflexi bacterium]|nr:hypothetical protein [Chloroflexota bacterium]
MKKKIALLSFCVVGLLVVLTLLAFSANAPYNAATSSTTNLDRPAQVNSSAPMSELTLQTNVSDEADFASVKSSSSGHHCEGEATSSAGY